MSLPLNILDLGIDEDPIAENPEERLEKGAKMVEEFAQQSSLAALGALLELARSGDRKAAVEAGVLANEATQNAAMLQSEVERFLSPRSKG